MSGDNSEYLELLNGIKHLIRSKPVFDNRWENAKHFPQCTCSYPVVIYRNGSGHAEGCPVDTAWQTGYKKKKVEAIAAQSVLHQPYCVHCDTPKEMGKINCVNCGAPYGREK